MTTEADILGRGMAQVAGSQVREMEARIERLERQLDVCINPHTRKCSGLWVSCTCGLRELMEVPAAPQ